MAVHPSYDHGQAFTRLNSSSCLNAVLILFMNSALLSSARWDSAALCRYSKSTCRHKFACLTASGKHKQATPNTVNMTTGSEPYEQVADRAQVHRGQALGQRRLQAGGVYAIAALHVRRLNLA